MCNYGLLIFYLISAPYQPCMSCRLVYHIVSVKFICIFSFSLDKINGWMDGYTIH